jgi:hypothetical protein
LIFKAAAGIRKYNIAEFGRHISVNELGNSIVKALSFKEKSFELDHMRNKLREFYMQRSPYDASLQEVVASLVSDSSFRSTNRDRVLLEESL